MPAFGENLRREREMRGVSLEEISSATKISLRFLEAIERENFARLPGGIFSRSFLRSYARYLGLDEERVVAEFQLAARPQTEFDLHRMPAGSASVGRRTTRTPLIATLVAFVLLAGGYALFRYSARGSEAQVPLPPAPAVTPKPAPPASAAPGTNPGVAGTAPDGTSAPPATPPTPGTSPTHEPAPSDGTSARAGTSAAPGATPNPQSGAPAGAAAAKPATPQAGTSTASKPAIPGDLLLQIAATDRAWVAVDADGKTVLQRVMNPNEVVTLNAHKSFDVTTGNAQAVILTLNGETRGPLGRHGEVKSVHLTREDLKNPSP